MSKGFDKTCFVFSQIYMWLSGIIYGLALAHFLIHQNNYAWFESASVSIIIIGASLVLQYKNPILKVKKEVSK